MDLQLSSLRADAVRRYAIDGLKVNGHPDDIVLLVRWAGSKDYQDALANQVFQKLEGTAREQARNKLIAQYLVTGFDSVPDGVTYTPARAEQIIATFERDERPDRMARFLAFLHAGDNFERRFVDAGDLGNG